MDIKGIVLSELSQQRKTNSVWSHLYVEALKNVWYNKTETDHRYREQISGCQRGGEWGNESKEKITMWGNMCVHHAVHLYIIFDNCTSIKLKKAEKRGKKEREDLKYI